MAGSLPPPPINEPPGSLAWQQWYIALTSLFGTSGAIPWIAVDTAGSNITDIATRPHNSLQSLQGGTSNEYYHLTSAQHTTLTTLAGLTGLSVTITTAKLTALGANGSMTFTNGLLTAQTAAT